jgi:hypothetical protein
VSFSLNASPTLSKSTSHSTPFGLISRSSLTLQDSRWLGHLNISLFLFLSVGVWPVGTNDVTKLHLGRTPLPKDAIRYRGMSDAAR